MARRTVTNAWCSVLLAAWALAARAAGGGDPVVAALGHLNVGRYEKAAELLQAAVAEKPKHSQAYRFLAKAQEGLWLWADAASACDRLAEFDLKDTSAVRRHAQLLRRFDGVSTNAGAALAPEQQATLRDVANDRYPHGLVRFAASELLGRKLFSSGKLHDAARHYARLADAPAAFQTGRYLSDYAQVLTEQGEFKQAAALLARLSKRPDAAVFGCQRARARCYGEWARSYLEAKDIPRAYTMLARARKLAPQSYLWEWVETCQRRGRLASAAQALESALAAIDGEGADWLGCPGPPKRDAVVRKLAAVSLSWAEYERRRKHYDRAAELYARAKELDPTATPGLSPDVLAKDREEAAQTLLDEAKQLIAVSRDCGRALLKFQAVVLNYPDTPQAVDAEFQAAYCHRRIGKPDRALALFGQFAKRHANHPLMTEALLRRVYILADRGRRPKEAIEECDALMKRYPGCRQAAEACYLRGMYYALMLKKNRAALECFYQTQERYPESTWATHWAAKRIKQLEE